MPDPLLGARRIADAVRDLGHRAQTLVLVCDEHLRGDKSLSAVDDAAHDVEEAFWRWEHAYEAHLDAEAVADDARAAPSGKGIE